IEGDYIETKQDNLIFDVKGLLHPNDRKICFIRFYPSPEGDRIKEGKKYKKIYNLKERYSFLRKKFPQHLFFSNELDLELQGVKNKNIKRIYAPREYLKKLTKKEDLSYFENCSKKLCELFINEGEIPENSIGITGSPMVGLNKDDSDIDLIIYGTATSIKFQSRLKKILNKSNNCRTYNLKEYKAHYNWRVGGSNILFKDFLKSEKRKYHQGKFFDFDFFIRYIKSPKDWQGNYYDYKYKNYGRIRLKAEILDAIDSIFTPCSYKINVLRVLDKSQTFGKIDKSLLCEIDSFRGRFCEQAIKGEIVLVEGKLEKVNFKDKEKYFRILLSDQIHDKMIPLNT
ncbi:MAG: hypothetical protein ACFFAN_15895, partial [Promethearchaeota archaeon]